MAIVGTQDAERTRQVGRLHAELHELARREAGAQIARQRQHVMVRRHHLVVDHVAELPPHPVRPVPPSPGAAVPA